MERPRALNKYRCSLYSFFICSVPNFMFSLEGQSIWHSVKCLCRPTAAIDIVLILSLMCWYGGSCDDYNLPSLAFIQPAASCEAVHHTWPSHGLDSKLEHRLGQRTEKKCFIEDQFTSQARSVLSKIQNLTAEHSYQLVFLEYLMLFLHSKCICQDARQT